jgi:predicted membrane channel-forming protein YqfA (hemolysin III family)
MSNLPETSSDEQANLSKAGQKKYSAAILTAAIGVILSCVFALLAIATATTTHSDTPGPGFYVFGFLALAVFLLSGLIAILISFADVIHYATMRNQNHYSRDGIAKSLGLILGILVAFLIAVKLAIYFR